MNSSSTSIHRRRAWAVRLFRLLTAAASPAIGFGAAFGADPPVEAIDRLMILQQRQSVTVVNGVQQIRLVNALVQVSETDPQTWVTLIFRTNDWGFAHKEASEKLEQRIAAIDSLLMLTEAQRTKLQLAGDGDIRRFIAECQQVFREVGELEEPRERLRRVRTESQTLRKRYFGGLHESDSLFAKTLHTFLDKSQREKLAEFDAERARQNRNVEAAAPQILILRGNRLIQPE